MSRTLTPQAAGMIGSVILLVGVIATFLYLDFVRLAKPEPVIPVATVNSAVIDTELKATDDRNVFLRTKSLRRPITSSDEQSKYNSGELGKNNLGQLE